MKMSATAGLLCAWALTMAAATLFTYDIDRVYFLAFIWLTTIAARLTPIKRRLRHRRVMVRSGVRSRRRPNPPRPEAIAQVEALKKLYVTPMEPHEQLAIDRKCGYCQEPLARELRFHQDCEIRMVAGSAAHQLGECTCFGGTREDPPNLSRREAARLAAETFRLLRGPRRL